MSAWLHINSFEPDTTSGVFTVAIYTIACISYANGIPAEHYRKFITLSKIILFLRVHYILLVINVGKEREQGCT